MAGDGRNDSHDYLIDVLQRVSQHPASQVAANSPPPPPDLEAALRAESAAIRYLKARPVGRAPLGYRLQPPRRFSHGSRAAMRRAARTADRGAGFMSARWRRCVSRASEISPVW